MADEVILALNRWRKSGMVSMGRGDGSTAQLTGIHIAMYRVSAILVNDVDSVSGGQVGPKLGQVLTKI